MQAAAAAVMAVVLGGESRSKLPSEIIIGCVISVFLRRIEDAVFCED